jgi:hypothetical protein
MSAFVRQFLWSEIMVIRNVTAGLGATLVLMGIIFADGNSIPNAYCNTYAQCDGWQGSCVVWFDDVGTPQIAGTCSVCDGYTQRFAVCFPGPGPCYIPVPGVQGFQECGDRFDGKCKVAANNTENCVKANPTSTKKCRVSRCQKEKITANP